MLPNKKTEIVNGVKWDYLLVYLIIATSAIPFFYLYIEFKIINLIVVLIVFLLRGKTIDKSIFIYIFLTLVIFLGQYLTFGIFTFTDYLSIIIRILIAYFTIKTVSFRFFNTYRNLIYLFAIISFFFYLPSVIIPGFSDFFISKISPFLNPPFQNPLKSRFTQQIILFNFTEIDELRNSGPLWEPGTFGGFLVIAIIINTIMNGSLFEKKNIVMIIALLSTFSTTNYIALFLFIMIYFIFIEKKLNAFIIVLPLLAIFIAIYFEADFLQKKINSQINDTNMYYKSGMVGNRFVSAKVDIEDFLKYPIFGKGISKEINKQVNSKFEGHRSNGLATYLANFGIIFFLFYFFNLYKSFFRLCSLYGYKKYLNYGIFSILMISGFSEEYYNFPFFYALTMLHLIIPKNILTHLEFKNKTKSQVLVSEYQ
ncbi:MAG: O-antigen ligase family protein [Ignavibacteriaceae bacterium]|nr:O-antigen ligase family protein [Ignavibacteriaceae bacterium]